MRDARLFRNLGFVRLGDYVVERLGISFRTAEELMQAEESLRRLPLVAGAFDRGEISAAHVRMLTRIVDASSETSWVDLARRAGARELRAIIERFRRESIEKAPRPEGGIPAGDDGGRGIERSGAATPPSSEPELERLELFAPAWISTLWRDSVTFIRELSGSAIPQGACLGVVLAEVSPAVPPAEPTVEGVQSRSPDGTTRPIHLLPEEMSRSRIPSPESEPCAACEPRPLDARVVDRALRHLMRERQRAEAAVAGYLRIISVSRSYRAQGFTSLEAYAADIFDISPPRLYCLLKLDKTLRSLPAARAAYLGGRLTLKQVLALDGVAAPWNEGAWIRRAAEVTLRRLEDEIAFWRHLRETRPKTWDLLDGGPLPAGIVLVPGRAPRLRGSARGAGSDRSSGGEGSPITAAVFLRALAADETLTPFPARMCPIRMLVEPGVHQAWRETVDHCRSVVRLDVRSWETLALVLREFWLVWDNRETRRQRRENPALERDGWRCAAPACRSIGTGNLHEHHVEFRATGGAVRSMSNLISLCVGHHLGLLHDGKMRCSGRAPDELVWEMGTEPGRDPFLVYEGLEKLIFRSGT